MEGNKSIMEKFGLPKWLEGKTFAEAAKIITKKTRGENNELNSADDVATEKSLMDKLQSAQEYVKQMNNPESQDSQVQLEQMGQQPPAAPMPEQGAYQDQGSSSNQYFLGGLLGGAGDMAGGAMPGLGAVQAGADLLGKVSNGGAETGDYVNAGVKAGLSFIPGGNMLNPLVDIGTSFIGQGKRNSKAADERHNLELSGRKERVNTYEYGGYTEPPKDTDPQRYSTKSLANLIKSSEDLLQDTNHYLKTGRNYERASSLPSAGLTSVTTPSGIGPINSRPHQTSVNGTKRIGLTDKMEGANIDTSLMNKDGVPIKNNDSLEDIANNILENNKSKFNPGKLLRYAPAAMNAAQLAMLEKPEQESYDRATSTYNRNYTDEKSLQNIVKGDVANMRNAISNSSGGSGSVNRANLLASQLKGTQAQSDAYMKSDMINRAEDDKFQNRIAENERVNLNQSNLETQANAANEGAYDTQKSKLLSALGDDLGGVGQEELFKEFPERMGLDYNSSGKNLNAEELRKKKLREAREILGRQKKKKK